MSRTDFLLRLARFVINLRLQDAAAGFEGLNYESIDSARSERSVVVVDSVFLQQLRDDERLARAIRCRAGCGNRRKPDDVGQAEVNLSGAS